MLAKVRTPSGATCKGVLRLEATFIDVKNMYLHQDSNLGLRNTFWNTFWVLWNNNLLAAFKFNIRKHLGKGV